MNFLREYLKNKRTKTDDYKKQMLEIETSGDENRKTIIKLIVSVKGLDKKMKSFACQLILFRNFLKQTSCLTKLKLIKANYGIHV